jgi:DNA-binding SARP family transcriptional activator
VGLAGVEAEPLRESAHRAVIKAHLAMGNRAEALRQYKRYAEVIRRELNLEPSPDLRSLAGVTERTRKAADDDPVMRRPDSGRHGANRGRAGWRDDRPSLEGGHG